MIALEELTKRYGDFTAVDSISFEVARGEVVGFLGPNGAGKSSTLRILAGFLAPSSGRARLAGLDVVEHGLEARARIGYLPENNPLYEDMDAAEYLEWTGRVRGMRSESLVRGVREAVEACQLGGVLGRPIGLLSKGYRQRVGLAGAILHDPEVLLLDEPTSGLDPNQALEVRALIRRLRREKTVLLSTHVLSEVEASCDRVVILNRGRIVADGTPAELASRAGAPKIRASLKAAGLERGELLEALRGLDGVRGAQAEKAGGEWRIRLEPEPDRDPRERVFRLAVERDWTLLELGREEASLESVFRELTP